MVSSSSPTPLSAASNLETHSCVTVVPAPGYHCDVAGANDPVVGSNSVLRAAIELKEASSKCESMTGSTGRLTIPRKTDFEQKWLF